MLVNCNSCQKKFTVPDSAITETGRLLQCGACGNKWTQYPVRLESIKEEKPKSEIVKKITPKIKQPPKVNKTKNLNKKKKREINLYSEEYLKKKHGLEIKDSINNKGLKKNKKNNFSFYFFNYLITTFILVIALFGILHMTKNFLITNYPVTEQYVNSLYEVLNISKLIILNLIN